VLKFNTLVIANVAKKVNSNHVSKCRVFCSKKIISKILANRFKGMLHHFISPHQSAFVPNRAIQDNTIIALEFLHTVNSKRGRGGLIAIKIHMEMKWNFILAILSKLGFHSTWINWIWICISSPSFSILINGSPMVISNRNKV
jgi:hypothetical protein